MSAARATDRASRVAVGTERARGLDGVAAVFRNKYNRRFVNKVEGFGKKGPNSNAGQAN